MKKNKLILSALLAGFTSVGIAQTANVEIIHNSPDPNAAVVDVYAMGIGLIADDLAYRSSNGVIQVPSGAAVNIGFAPSTSNTTGNGEADVLFTVDNQGPFAENENYIVIANGFTPLTTTGYSEIPAFSLDVFAGSQAAASGGAGTNDVLVFHGSTDAPNVEVDELLQTGGAQVVSNLGYGSFIPAYLNLGVEDYLLQIQAATNGPAVAAYSAPLAALGIDGAALTVVASGFLDPTINSNGSAFGLFVSTGAAGALLPLPSPTARVEVIHNAADTLLDVVDVFVNGDETFSDFAFRTTTGFIDLPAGMPLDINAAPDGAGLGGSVDLADIPFLAPDSTYIAIANGTVSPGYSPQQTIGLDIFLGAREAATSGMMNTDVLVYHGVTDAPAVDVAEVALANATLVDDLAYGGFEMDYLELPSADYTLQVQEGSASTPLAAYDAPLAGLSLQGAAVTVLASGFFDANNQGPGFGLWASTGAAGPLVELPSAQTRIEIIHNAADTALDVVDVFVNGDLTLPNFAFRTTTGFIDLPAGMPLQVNAAPAGAGFGGSVTLLDVPALFSDSTYIAIANGTLSAGYSPQQPLGVDVFIGAREAGSNPAETDILVYHGATDAPAVDVDVVANPAVELVNGAAYGGFAGYLTVPTLDYTLQIQADANDAAVAAFDAPLATLMTEGAALTVLASGFLDTETNAGPAFGLWASTGAPGPLLELPSPEARIEIIHNSADAAAASVDVFVNGAEAVSDFDFRTTTGFITLPAGMPLAIDVAPADAGIGSSVGTIEIPFLGSGKTYIAIANGIVSMSGYAPSAMDAPFGLDIYDEAREVATSSATNTDILVYHGSTDAPTVDVFESGVGAGTIVDDIAYGEFNSTGYLELGTENYQLIIQDETGAVNVATFDAPLATLMTEGAALTVLASGFLDPTMNSDGAGFGLWVSLGSEGDLIPLTNVTGIEDVESINNAGLFPNPTNDNATMFFDLIEDENINLEVVNTMGQRVVVKSFGEMLSGNHRVEIPSSKLAPGFYFVNLRTNSGVVSTKLQIVR